MSNKIHKIAQIYFEKTVAFLIHRVHVHKPGGGPIDLIHMLMYEAPVQSNMKMLLLSLECKTVKTLLYRHIETENLFYIDFRLGLPLYF
jgi:hypothetical protein